MSTYYAYKCKTCRPIPTFRVQNHQWISLVDPDVTECDFFLSRPIALSKLDDNFEFVGTFQGEPTNLFSTIRY